MMTAFGQLIFTAPWALAALAVLPALYFLLRVTPPAPKLIRFPATRFLEGLVPKQNTPSHTPWWILLLRLLAAALLLLGLAGPVLNPSSPLAGNGPLRLVIENGWSAAPNWDAMIKEADAIITGAGRENREIIILTTTDETGKKENQQPNLLNASNARAVLKSLKPYPWEANLKTLDLPSFEGRTLWLSDGLEKNGLKNIFEKLESAGGLSVISPRPENMPALLKAAKTSSPMPGVYLESATKDIALTIQALNQKGQILDQKNAAQNGDIHFDLPQNLRNQIASFQIAEQKSAGTHFLLQNAGGPKNIGIISPTQNADSKTLNDDSFFLKKALEPFANITTGSLQDILATPQAMIILPDIGAMPAETLNALDSWVRGGGLILRFAGPNMTRQPESLPLTPVKLRNDARALEGAMSWDKPLKLLPFAPESPLYGITLADDITITRQILPEAGEDLTAKTWASLEDGTPLITAAPHDGGFLIMVHTTASPAWSNLPLSGLYLEILKRFVNYAGNTERLQNSQDGVLQPLRTFDGLGVLQKPSSETKGIDASVFSSTPPSFDHPPGFYGRDGWQMPLNIGNFTETLTPLNRIAERTYGAQKEHTLHPYLIALAFSVLLLDTIIMIAISSRLGLMRRPAMLLLLAFLVPQNALAQESQYAQGLYLAYIKTSNAAIDAQTARGLENMGQILGARTSAEPQGVVGVDLERDDLAFFPMIYWTIETGQSPLSESATEKLQFYLDHGGTIFIDTRDGTSGKNAEILKNTLQSLNIQPLMPLPADHVLTKSFYLLKNFPGRLNDGKIWVETQSAGRDGVSSVILGSNDWAGAWSEINIGTYGTRTLTIGTTHEQELSLRCGINFMLYALTGNYKSDQVHVPAILERLGR